MNILNILNGKLSIVLTLAMSFIALTTFASAQDKNYDVQNLNGITHRIWSTDSSSLNSLTNDLLFGSSTVMSQTGNDAGRHSGGANVILADGSVRFSFPVFEVLLPNSPLEFDRVDAQDPNAAVKIRMLLDAANRMQSGFVLIVPKNSVGVPARFRRAKLSVGSGESRMEIKMQDVLVSSWNNSGSPADQKLDYLVITMS